MEEKNKVELVEIKGQKYPLNSPLITMDHWDGRYILKDDINTLEIISSINLDRATGFRAGVTFVYTQSDDQIDQCIKLICNDGLNRWMLPNVRIAVGNGSFHLDPNKRRTAYDDPSWVRVNKLRDNKFRPFNNLVKKFKDINNPYLTDDERKQILDRDIIFGVRSNTYKAFEGLQYTFGVELETSSGCITELDCNGLNLKCEFDGSLRDTPDQRKEDVLGKRKKSINY